MHSKQFYTAPSVELFVLQTEQNLLLNSYNQINQTESIGRDPNETDL